MSPPLTAADLTLMPKLQHLDAAGLQVIADLIVKSVFATLPDIIDPPAGKTGYCTEQRADYKNQRCAHKTYRKAYSCAHHKANGKVSAELIRSADVRKYLLTRVYLRLFCFAVLKRGEVLAVFYLLLIAVRPKAGKNVSKNHYQ